MFPAGPREDVTLGLNKKTSEAEGHRLGERGGQARIRLCKLAFEPGFHLMYNRKPLKIK